MRADVGAETLKRLVEGYEGRPDTPVVEFLLAKQGQGLIHGTPWLRIKYGADPPRSVNVSGELPLGIAFGQIGLNSQDMPKIAEAVMEIIRVFALDFPER